MAAQRTSCFDLVQMTPNQKADDTAANNNGFNPCPPYIPMQQELQFGKIQLGQLQRSSRADQSDEILVKGQICEETIAELRKITAKRIADNKALQVEMAV